MEEPHRNIRRITIIQMNNAYPDLAARLLLPRYGPVLIGTVLRDLGFDVQVFVEHIQTPDWDRIRNSDLLCFSLMSASANRTYQIISRIRREGIETPIVVGGTHTTYFPEDCLNHADIVVRGGEGDAILPVLVEAMNANASLADVPGISYRSQGKVIHNPDWPDRAIFRTAPDYSIVAGFQRHGFWRRLLTLKAPLVSVQSSRGCDHSCAFCITPRMFGRSVKPGVYVNDYRRGAFPELFESWRVLSQEWGRHFYFVDNQLVTTTPSRREESIAFLRQMIDARLGITYSAEARLEVADDAEMLSLLRDSGCLGLSFGFESVSQRCLDRYGKGQNVADYERLTANVRNAGIRVSGSFILGSDEDTVESIRDDVRFAMGHLYRAYFFVLGDYQAFLGQQGGLISPERVFVDNWDHYNGFFVTHYPKNMPPSVLQQELADAWRRFYSPRRLLLDLLSGSVHKTTDRFGLLLTARAFSPALEEYRRHLETIEGDMYDRAGHLKEELLQRQDTCAALRCARNAVAGVRGDAGDQHANAHTRVDHR